MHNTTPLACLQVHEGTQGPVLIHQDVQETKKPGAIGAHLKLCTPLTVCTFANQEGDAFDDLDELIARYAEPYIASFKTLTKHRCELPVLRARVLPGSAAWGSLNVAGRLSISMALCLHAQNLASSCCMVVHIDISLLIAPALNHIQPQTVISIWRIHAHEACA